MKTFKLDYVIKYTSKSPQCEGVLILTCPSLSNYAIMQAKRNILSQWGIQVSEKELKRVTFSAEEIV